MENKSPLTIVAGIFVVGLLVSNALTLYHAFVNTGQETGCSIDICQTLPAQYQTTTGYLMYTYGTLSPSDLSQGGWIIYVTDIFQYLVLGAIVSVPIWVLYRIADLAVTAVINLFKKDKRQ